ncbi:MAG TPA: TRAP transporter TatT component family protein [Verrucomicrobiota bacterium]|nr:TRAP transporter TatT component family protein [Verrucomicrobiota bacterium]
MVQFLWLAVIVSITGGCSFKRIAVNKVGNALAGGGTTFASDDDPELIKAATPFSLKLMESLLAESPKHKGLLFATASGFTQFSYAFVQLEADEMEATDVTKAMEMRKRAQKLYLRARDYGLRGLEAAHPGFTNALRADSKNAVKKLRHKDVPITYWTAASWAAAVSVVKDDPELIADLPLIETLIERALALDEAYDNGAIHTFMIAYEMARPRRENDPATRARGHFDRAVRLSGGLQAAPFVSMAENVAVPQQDMSQFETLLNTALAIDVNAKPEWRLQNIILQRRARWLLDNKADLIEQEPN